MKLLAPCLLTCVALIAIIACESEAGGPQDSPSTTTIFNSPRSTCVIEAEGASPICFTIDESGKTCAASPDHISFYDDLVLPAELPPGMSLAEACLTGSLPGIPDSQIAELIYQTADGTKNIHVSTARIVPVQAQGRPEIQLGERIGYVRDVARTDNTALYSVEFERDGRAYTVIAILGPENTSTREEMNAVALSMATAES